MEELSPPPPDLPSEPPQISPEELRRQRQILFVLVGVAFFFLVSIIISVAYLLQPTTPTSQIADIFIIFMALESLVLMFTLVILIIQLSVLINLIQNDIRPIIISTNETVSTLRGTAAFLSENLTEPVIKMNEYFAGFQHLFALFGLTRSSKSKNKSDSQGA
jgi:hypothetical protein